MDNRLRMLRLVERILDGNLSRHRHNCPADITDLFFLEIENDDFLLEDYNILIQSKDSQTINSQLGRIIKSYWGLKNLGRCYSPKSKLIESYEMHKG